MANLREQVKRQQGLLDKSAVAAENFKLQRELSATQARLKRELAKGQQSIEARVAAMHHQPTARAQQ